MAKNYLSLITGVMPTTDMSITFNANTTKNTPKTITIDAPKTSIDEYQIITYNPSTATDLTCKVFSVETNFASTVTYNSYITSFSVPKKQTITGTTITCYTAHVHGIFNGTDCVLKYTNDSNLGAGSTFSPRVRIREVR